MAYRQSEARRSQASGSETHSCPICREPFYGDLPAFENHVHGHFADDGQPEQGRATESTNDRPNNITDEALDDHSQIECDAPGCNMKVQLEDIAEHMDRHLAERIQSQDTIVDPSKRPHNAMEPTHKRRPWHRASAITNSSKENTPRKVAKTTSSKTLRAREVVVNGIKALAQTTIDGFVRVTDQEANRSGASGSRPTRLVFGPKPPPGPIKIAGLIPKARLLLEVSRTQGITKQAYLADPSIVFCRGDQDDRGWGCGYRNIQMMLSYVLRRSMNPQEGLENADNKADMEAGFRLIPSIAELQEQIEFAWMNGFDPSGASQLNHKVVGTKKWIGTTEAWSVLCSLGIRCSILDFHTPTGPNGTHPAMLSAIYNYFRSPAWSPLIAPEIMSVSNYDQYEEDQRIIQTSKPPLYIQHQGHSRTIIGIEITTTGELNLLVFDPGRWLHKAIPTLREGSISKERSPTLGSKAAAGRGLLDAQYLLKAFRLQLHPGMAKAQYQLLGISGLYHEDDGSATYGERNMLSLHTRGASLSIGWSDEEAEQSKLISSTRVP